MYFTDADIVAFGRVIPSGSKVNEAVEHPGMIKELMAVMAAGGPVRYEPKPDNVTRDDSAAPIKSGHLPGKGRPKR
jgi:hypothetical protein